MIETFDGKEIDIENRDKVLFPGDGITKGDMIDYYEHVAEYMIPHTKDRPISMHRFPDGIEGEGFYHKDVPDYFPDWLKLVKIPKEDGFNMQVVINDMPTLVFLADQATITPHIWLSKRDKLDKPDKIVFDMDPPENKWKGEFGRVKAASKIIRDLFNKLGLRTYVMTTGSKGLHVVSFIKRTHTFDEVKEFCRQVAEYLIWKYPDEFTLEMRKKNRGNKIFVDYLRNEFAQTSVPPYAIRAKPTAPVATPLEWAELNSLKSPREYTIKNIFRRLAQKPNPWGDYDKNPDSVAQAMEKLAPLLRGIG